MTTINPKLGMICTMNAGNDEMPAVINEIINAKEVQVCRISRGMNGKAVKRVKVYTLRRNGEWVRKGKPMNSTLTLTLGEPNRSFDPSF